MKESKTLLAALITTLICGCYHYGVNPQGDITCISTKLKRDIIISLTDSINKRDSSFALTKELNDIIPGEYEWEKELNPTYYYFKNAPSEVYIIHFPAGIPVIVFVYDLNNNQWISSRSNVKEEFKNRIRERFKKEVLDRIEMEARKLNLPDTKIYKDFVDCTY